MTSINSFLNHIDQCVTVDFVVPTSKKCLFIGHFLKTHCEPIF